MASRIDFRTLTDVSPTLRSFSCGCRVASGPGDEFRIDWCPYHELSHGELVEASSPSEQQVPVKNAGDGRARSGAG
jgi:hypothetical protein